MSPFVFCLLIPHPACPFISLRTGCRCTIQLRVRCSGSCRVSLRPAGTVCSGAAPCSFSAQRPSRVCSPSARVAAPAPRFPSGPPPLPLPVLLLQHRLQQPPLSNSALAHSEDMRMRRVVNLVMRPRIPHVRSHWTLSLPLPTITRQEPTCRHVAPPPLAPAAVPVRTRRRACCSTSAPATAT